MTDWPTITVKQVLQWRLRMLCARKIQDLQLCMCKLAQILKSVTQQLHFSHRFDLIIIKFTCRFYENLLGDQGVKAICDSLKAMRNLQLLQWVSVGTNSQLTCIGGVECPVTFSCPLIFSIHRVHHTFMNSCVPMTTKLVVSSWIISAIAMCSCCQRAPQD